jgi:glycosyltransferase involved in cell wall biosynthesis
MPRPRWAYVTLQRRGGGDAGDTHVDAVIAGLRGAGCDVQLVAPRRRAPLVRHVLSSLSVQLRLIGALRRFDVVYVRMHPLATLIVVACRWIGIRVVLEVNGVPNDFQVAHPALRYVRKQLEWLVAHQLRAAAAVIAVTPGLAQWVSEASGRTHELHVVPNAADPAAFRPGLPRPADAPNRYVIFVGSLSAWQGLELCLDAALHEAWPSDTVLLIIGDGALQATVEAAATAAPDRICWLGRRQPRDVPPYLSNALVSLALKQYHDERAGQSPLKVFESMASEVPVVATPLHGMALIAEHDAGVVLARMTPASVASTVACLVSDEQQRREMGARGREAILHANTWEHRVDAILDVATRGSSAVNT